MRFPFSALLLVVMLGIPGQAGGSGRPDPRSYPPLVQAYPPSAYGAATQNFSAVQDPRGILYFGNFDGVLEFDGVNWRTLALPGREVVFSLAVSGDRRVYVGSQGEIGYLEPQGFAGMRYVSLRGQLPAGAPTFRNVFQTLAISDEVHFVSEEALLSWRRGRITALTPAGRFQRAAAFEGKLFALDSGAGLVSVSEGALTPRLRHPLPEGAVPSSMVPWARQGREDLLIATRNHGIFLFDGLRIRPFRCGADALLKEATLAAVSVLPDGGLALGTRQGGAVLVDPDGTVRMRITTAEGLPTDRVLGMSTDDQGGLWLALNRGLARVSLNPWLRGFHAGTGVEGPLSMCDGPDGPIAGTSRGLARLERVGGGAVFRPLPGPKDQVWCLLRRKEGVFAGTSEGLFAYGFQGGNAPFPVKIGSEPVFAIAESRRDPDLLFLGTFHGLATLRRERGRWVIKAFAEEVRDDIKSIQEDADGSLWAESGLRGVLHLRARDGWGQGAPVTVERFGLEAGLPDLRNNQVFSGGGRILFATRKGIYAFDPASARVAPDPAFGRLFPEGPRWVLSPVWNREGGLWLISADPPSGIIEPGLAVPAGDGSYRWSPFPYPPLANLNTSLFLHLDENGAVWSGSPEDGLFWADPRVSAGRGHAFPVLVRSILKRDGLPLSMEHAEDGECIWSYAPDSLRFSYAAVSLERPGSSLYQVMLEGHDLHWSPWIKESYRDYSNLPEGSYRLRVRARNFRGAEGQEVSVRFRILPPWYRSPWAEVSGGALFLAAILGLVQWRQRVLSRRNRKLEGQIRDATREIELERSKLARLNTEKSQMMGVLAHDIRNPLTAVLCYSDKLMEEPQGTPGRDLGSRIHTSVDTILELVKRLLDPRLLQGEAPVLRMEAVDLHQAVSLAAGALAPRAQAKGQRIEVRLADAAEPVIQADPVYLNEILDNLISNAIKFTPCGPPERIVRVDVGRRWIVVQDEGPGIAAHEAQRLYDPFYRGSARPTGGETSFGLGLFIVKKWMEAMGGSIALDSEPGRGARFTLHFGTDQRIPN